MGFLVLMGIVFVLGLIGFFGGRVAKTENPSGPGGIIAGASLVGMVLLLIVLGGCGSYAQVETGHIGVVKEFGTLKGTMPDGPNWKAPWQSVDEVSIQNELRTYEMTGGNSAVSSDSQPVFLVVQVNYSLVPEGVVPLYRQTGGRHVERILDPAVFQNTKQITAEYKAIDFAKNREAIRQKIEQAVQNEAGSIRVNGTDVQVMRINNVTLKNVSFTQALSKAIEQTVEAEQQAKRAQAQVAIKEAEARQLAASAKGEADAQRERAQGAADAVKLAAQAEAYRVRQEGQALRQNPQVLQLRAIEKLNPNVQLIVPEGSTLVQGLDGKSVVTP